MKVQVIAFTEKGYRLSEELKSRWLYAEKEGQGLFKRSGRWNAGNDGAYDGKTEICLHAKTKALPDISDQRELGSMVASWFGVSVTDSGESVCNDENDRDKSKDQTGDKASVIIFIGSTGIAVRAIAPFLIHKSEDPAVLVIDEAGHFVISLLSGHIGGANEFTAFISELIKAQPVITTASDIEGAFSVDVFAKENGFIISDFGKAKEVAAKVLRGEKLRIYSDIGMENLVKRPGIVEAEMLSSKEIDRADIVISYRTKYLQYEEPVIRPFDAIGLRLAAKRVYVGIGARKGVSEEDVMKAYDNCLKSSGIDSSSVAALVSIDIKKNEQGILTFSYKREIPFITYTPEELSSVIGDFAASAFVQSVTGVSNVCERAAAYAASRNGREKVLVHKQIYGNVTLAVAVAM
ncbi:cobalt-precorrin 5A hydrolase [Oribacterium sp. WCC10]|uniref:cobalt-precorrin 5A hydrolase n=1 Tax=Oribacterium sp. WCC10 TaxID=1855343 RepID=UPI0008F071FB|nr:cobalamin biosynthesis protein [Oribacterium sp. WCC10]SFG73308.1 cobalt-precorrin 5A acetaldehyde-lyase [Oribacterium sp. WCC10]